jgi:hypothetical protein
MAINNFNVGVGTTSQLTRYRYVATGGETSVSGTDADGKTLSYTVGLEQVFLNGVNLVRGQDYTATNGTSVGSLTALVASDVVEVFAYVPFNIANALTVSTVDAKGDLLVGTGADAVGRLAVGTNGQLLSAASGETTGLKWANPGMTLIKTETFSAVASHIISNVFSATYDDYKVMLNIDGVSSDGDITVQLRTGATTVTSNYQTTYRGIDVGAGNEDNALSSGSYWNMGNTDAGNNNHMYFLPFDLSSPFRAQRTVLTGSVGFVDTAGNFSGRAGASNNLNATSYESLVVGCSAGNITGSVSIYGYNK